MSTCDCGRGGNGRVSAPAIKVMILTLLGAALVSPFTRRPLGAISRSRYENTLFSKGEPMARDDEIRALYEKAQLDDAEWLQKVFGGEDSPLKPKGSIEGDSKNMNSVKSSDITQSKSQQESDPDASYSAIRNKEMRQLFELGYNPQDIASIKDSVLMTILERAVARPRRGLPLSWIKSEAGQPSRGSGSGERSSAPRRTDNQATVTSKDGRTAAPADNMLPKKRAQPRQEDRLEVEDVTGGIGEAFYWKGSKLTSEEREVSRRIRGDGELFDVDYDNRDRDRDRDRRAPSRGQRSSSSRESDEEEFLGEWHDDKDGDGPAPFWPDSKEFKEMLIDESQWRSNLIGGWSMPFIKAEVKWRYQIYKNWLKFLDEGLGDGFDVVQDRFDDYYDEEYYGDDDDDRDYRGDFGKSASYRGDYDSPRSYDDRNGDDAVYRPPSARRAAPSGASASPSTNSRRRERLPSSKAEAYDRWIRERVGNEGEWTDLAGEEKKAMRELRLAAEKRELEEWEAEQRMRVRSRARGRGGSRRGDDGGVIDGYSSYLEGDDDWGDFDPDDEFSELDSRGGGRSRRRWMDDEEDDYLDDEGYDELRSGSRRSRSEMDDRGMDRLSRSRSAGDERRDRSVPRGDGSQRGRTSRERAPGVPVQGDWRPQARKSLESDEENYDDLGVSAGAGAGAGVGSRISSEEDFRKAWEMSAARVPIDRSDPSPRQSVKMQTPIAAGADARDSNSIGSPSAGDVDSVGKSTKDDAEDAGSGAP